MMEKKGIKLEIENSKFKVTNVGNKRDNLIILICQKETDREGIFKFCNEGKSDDEKYFQKSVVRDSNAKEITVWCTLFDGKYVQLDISSLEKNENFFVDKICINDSVNETDISVIVTSLFGK